MKKSVIVALAAILVSIVLAAIFWWHVDAKSVMSVYQGNPYWRWFFVSLVVLFVILLLRWLSRRGLGIPVASSSISWRIPRFLVEMLIFSVIVGAVIITFFQRPRDLARDLMNRQEVRKVFSGTTTVRSVLVTKLEGFDICELEPDTKYMFVETRTERQNGDEISYRIRNRRDGSEQIILITGMLSSTPEKLPYEKGDYDFGVLVDGNPPGRFILANKEGCVKGSFNTNLGQYYDIVPIRMGFHFRK